MEKQDSIVIACFLEELATGAARRVFDRGTVDMLGRAVGANDRATIGDALERLAQRVRRAAPESD